MHARLHASSFVFIVHNYTRYHHRPSNKEETSLRFRPRIGPFLGDRRRFARQRHINVNPSLVRPPSNRRIAFAKAIALIEGDRSPNRYYSSGNKKVAFGKAIAEIPEGDLANARRSRRAQHDKETRL